MSDFKIDPRIFQNFPGVRVGILVIHDLDNSVDRQETIDLLRSEEQSVRNKISIPMIPEHPHINPWRDAYRAFGAKPKEYQSSIENLLRRVLKGNSIPDINTLVNIYNIISLKYLIPAGGEDLDSIRGDIELTFAGDQEPEVRLLGEPEPRRPKPGEVIYRDDISAICRRWNWKEADRTKLSRETRSAVLVLEALPPAGRELLESALQDLSTLIQEFCGGETRTAILDEDAPQLSLL